VVKLGELIHSLVPDECLAHKDDLVQRVYRDQLEWIMKKQQREQQRNNGVSGCIARISADPK
jgi:hypothetical protein